MKTNLLKLQRKCSFWFDIHPAYEMLDALEEIMQEAMQYNTLVERFSFRISNGLQV